LGKHGAGGCQVVVRKVGRWHRGQYCLCGAMPASGWAERALLCELTLFASTLALLVSVWEWPWFGIGVRYKRWTQGSHTHAGRALTACFDFRDTCISCLWGGHLQQQVSLGGAAATCMGRCPIVPGSGCTQGFSVTLVTMGVSGMCENMWGGWVQAARPKGGGQRKIDLNTSRYGQFFRANLMV
jgi:hypothetical protein